MSKIEKMFQNLGLNGFDCPYCTQPLQIGKIESQGTPTWNNYNKEKEIYEGSFSKDVLISDYVGSYATKIHGVFCPACKFLMLHPKMDIDQLKNIFANSRDL